MKTFVLACALLVGCSSSDDATNAVADSAPVDTGALADTSSVTDSAVDVVDDAVDAVEASADAVAETTTDAGMCDYVDLDDVVVKCSGKYRLLGRFDVSPASASCPPFWAFGGKPPHYETKEAAIAGQVCDATCVWTFATSATRVYCGHKDGYETLKATTCADVYRFSEGYYESVEAHDAANPCP